MSFSDYTSETLTTLLGKHQYHEEFEEPEGFNDWVGGLGDTELIAHAQRLDKIRQICPDAGVLSVHSYLVLAYQEDRSETQALVSA